MAAGPPELTDATRRLLDIAKLTDSDPTLKNDSSRLLSKLGKERVEQGLRDSQAVQDWFRRNCGPDSASAAWCEAWSRATLDRELAVVDAMLSPNATSFIGEADRASLARYRAIRGSVPQDLTPHVQLLIDQYDSNGGRQPQDAAAVTARTKAQDEIVASLRDQCGITVSRGEL